MERTRNKYHDYSEGELRERRDKFKNKIGLIKIVAFVIIGVSFAFFMAHLLNDLDSNEAAAPVEMVDFSSPEYEDLDFGNVTYEAVDPVGTPVQGDEWFGVNGQFSQEEPLVFGENEYVYWIDSETHFVEPGILSPDIYHTEQKVLVPAVPFNNEPKIRVRQINRDGFYDEENIVFEYYDELDEIAQIDIDFYESSGEAFLPFGGILMIEMDRSVNDITCTEFYERHQLDAPALHSVDTRAYYFEIPQGYDGYDYALHNTRCMIERNKNKELNYNKIHFRFFPADFFIEDGELKIGVENYNMELIRNVEYDVTLEVKNE